jgi:hypothetical protein
MTFAIQTRSLPSRFSAYPATVEGVEGYVVSINGEAAFVDHAQADAIGRYVLFDGGPRTEPIDVVSPIVPQVRDPHSGD